MAGSLESSAAAMAARTTAVDSAADILGNALEAPESLTVRYAMGNFKKQPRSTQLKALTLMIQKHQKP